MRHIPPPTSRHRPRHTSASWPTRLPYIVYRRSLAPPPVPTERRQLNLFVELRVLLALPTRSQSPSCCCSLARNYIPSSHTIYPFFLDFPTSYDALLTACLRLTPAHVLGYTASCEFYFLLKTTRLIDTSDALFSPSPSLFSHAPPTLSNKNLTRPPVNIRIMSILQSAKRLENS